MGEGEEYSAEVPTFKGAIYSRSNYFKDGRRKIDFVLVTNLVKLPTELDMLSYYLSELMIFGIELEISRGRGSPELIFIKLHCPKRILEEYAAYHHFKFDYQNPLVLRSRNRWFPCHGFHNVLTELRPNDPSFKRAHTTLSTNKAAAITSWERSVLMHKILNYAKFSDSHIDHGFKKLIANGVLKDAYPIHDGPSKWRPIGPLTDRQLLNKYWASISAIFKHQPLPSIFKYFGPEVAFYFAFADFIMKMLVVPGFIGLLLLLYNAIARNYFDTVRITDACESNLRLCPLCFDERGCRFKPLSDLCVGAHIQPLFDNFTGCIFAVFMGFWSIVVIAQWKRHEYTLKFRWNLLNVESDSAYRLEFLLAATRMRMRISPVTGEKEYYIPLRYKMINQCRTLAGLLLMVTVVVFLIFLNTLYRVEVTKLINISNVDWLKEHSSIIIMCTSAVIMTLIISYLAPLFKRFSVYLTNKENPRTYVDFINACIYKVYATSFANGYFPFFYAAFLKGVFFTHPGDDNVYDVLSLRTDICNVNGCAYALTLTLMFFFGLKNTVHRLVTAIVPYAKAWRARRRNKSATQLYLPIWERDYTLMRTDDLCMMGFFMVTTMQYGYVLFFIAALQVLPLIVLLVNVVNLRVDAMAILRNYRRPVAKCLPGIGAWNKILRIITFIGVACNAFVIAFTSDLWQRLIYEYLNSDLQGYLNSTLSEFAVEDYTRDVEGILKREKQNIDVCVYVGKRNPYYSIEKYELSHAHWHVLTYKLGFVVVFEQLLWLIMTMVATFRDCVPPSIKDYLRQERQQMKALRFQAIGDQAGFQLGRGHEDSIGDDVDYTDDDVEQALGHDNLHFHLADVDPEDNFLIS